MNLNHYKRWITYTVSNVKKKQTDTKDMKVGLVKYKTKSGKNVERYAKAGRCSTCG